MQGENDGGVGGGVGFWSPLPLLLFRYEKIGAFFFGYFFIWNMFDGFMEWYVMKKNLYFPKFVLLLLGLLCWRCT